MQLRDEDLPKDRTFGRTFAVLFALLGGYLIYRGTTAWPALAFAASVGLLGLAEFQAGWLRIPNRLWAGLGMVLGKITGTLVLGVIFFVLITPLAVGMRLFGRDELRLRRPMGSSYWRDRQTEPTDFSRQF